MRLTIQVSDFSTEEFWDYTVEEVIDAFDAFGWEGEWEQYHEKNVAAAEEKKQAKEEAKDEEQGVAPASEEVEEEEEEVFEDACPPGFILGHKDSDKTIHIFMENYKQFDLFFDYTEPVRLLWGLYRTKKRVHNFRANISHAELHRIIRLFAEGDYETLKPLTREQEG